LISVASHQLSGGWTSSLALVREPDVLLLGAEPQDVLHARPVGPPVPR
jgi:hypothetical protein